MRRWLAALGLLLCAAAWAAGDGQVALPTLSARVTDLTQTLSAEQRGSLASELAAIEGETGAQVAMLLLPTTQPETIEQFGIRLAEAWKIGHKGADNGVIVIVAKNDRKVRIEVGYGLEGALNDATCQRIIREQIAPRFKGNDYYGGLQAAIAGMLPAIKSEMPAAADHAVERNASPVELDRVDRFTNWLGALGGGHENLFWILIGGVLIGVTALRFFLGDFLGSSVVAGLTGIAAFFLTLSIVTALIAAVAGFLVALVGVNFIWAAILSGGSGGGGGGSGGGGFSGGGGSFGGGGSSGSW